MSGLTDIHCHLVPYVDDGAENLDEALELIRIEKAQGVSRIYLTPHRRAGMFETPTAEINRHFENLKKAVKENIDNPPELILGREHHCDREFLKLLENGRVQTLGNSKNILIEFSARHSLSQIADYINAVRQNGLRPVIAHIERFPIFEQCPQAIERLLEFDNLIQINAGSVLGKEGGLKRRTYCAKLIKNNWVTFIGTDSHETFKRKPNLEDCFLYVKKKFGAEKATELFLDNPKILEEDIHIHA